MGASAALIWLERRLLGLSQDRYGPNRVGPFGLMQVTADMIKIFFKEDWIPPFADRPVFVVAPAIIVVAILLSYAVIPFTPGIVISDLNIGLLFFLANALAERLRPRFGRLVFQEQVRASWKHAGYRPVA